MAVKGNSLHPGPPVLNPHYLKQLFVIHMTVTVVRSYFSVSDTVFANSPGDRGSIPGRVIPKTEKIVLDAALVNTQHYKVRITGKVERFRE